MLYARELCEYFRSRPDLEVHAVCPAAGEQVLRLELGLELEELMGPRTILHAADNYAAPLASGSFRVRAIGHSLLHGDFGRHCPAQARRLCRRAFSWFWKS